MKQNLDGASCFKLLMTFCGLMIMVVMTMMIFIYTEAGTKKKKKGSAYQTISATHRVIIISVTILLRDFIELKTLLYDN